MTYQLKVCLTNYSVSTSSGTGHKLEDGAEGTEGDKERSAQNINLEEEWALKGYGAESAFCDLPDT